MNKTIKNIKPLIFTKKVNNNTKIIPLALIKNTLGQTKHFPVATREWFNSIYTYNNNSTKSLSIADKNFSAIITSYFNFYFKKNLLYYKRIPTKYKLLKINKVFVGKAQLKHTNSKVTITLYVYNEEKRLIINKLRKISETLLNLKDPLSLINKKKDTNSVQIKLSLIEYFNLLKSKYMSEILDKEKTLFNNEGKSIVMLHLKFLYENLKEIDGLIFYLNNKVLNLGEFNNIYTLYIKKIHLNLEIKTIAYYKLLLNLNRYKFEDKALSVLKALISKLYNKEVQFNIVNLKTIYFNSDIFTQVIALKLRKRKNKLLTVLNSALHMIKLPNVNKMEERYARTDNKKVLINIIKNKQINLIDNYYNKKDILDQLLLDTFPAFYGARTSYENSTNNNVNTIEDFVLNSLKYKKIGGARLEVRGRLTKRFTASRSIFMLKWKGSLRNIDSSYKQLSSVILRGHLRSNIQHSLVNSKTRNGAFGLKGWISGK